MYRNLDLSANIFDCLLMAIAYVQAVDRKASFLFVDDVNAYHEEWLGSVTTNLHGIGLRVTLPHRRAVSRWLRTLHPIDEGVFDLVLTDVANVVDVRVSSRVGALIIVPFLEMLC